jgi:hypothetical protein
MNKAYYSKLTAVLQAFFHHFYKLREDCPLALNANRSTCVSFLIGEKFTAAFRFRSSKTGRSCVNYDQSEGEDGFRAFFLAASQSIY